MMTKSKKAVKAIARTRPTDPFKHMPPKRQSTVDPFQGENQRLVSAIGDKDDVLAMTTILQVYATSRHRLVKLGAITAEQALADLKKVNTLYHHLMRGL